MSDDDPTQAIDAVGADEPAVTVRRIVRIGDPSVEDPDLSTIIDPLLTGGVRPVLKSASADKELDVEVQAGKKTFKIGGDDVLPDATYTVTNSRSPEDVKGPRVHPRMKARRIAVKQAAGRRRIWWVGVLIVVLVVGLAALAVFSSSLFDVEQIRVTGAANSDPAEIAEITDDIKGKAILTADLNSVRERLELLPWVKYAEVTMKFPHTVLIQIAERSPVAAFQSADSRWRVIDIDGRVIDVLAGRPIDYVAIFGPGPDKIAGESAPEYANIAQFVTALPPTLRPLVQYFEVDSQFDVVMAVRLNGVDDTEVELCAANRLDVQQLVALSAFISTQIDPAKPVPGRIIACKPDLITTAAT